MNDPSILKLDHLVLAGFNFYGDPFRSSAGWSEENEIGRTWSRLMSFLQANESLVSSLKMDCSYEVHLLHPESQQTGEFEIFVGLELPGEIQEGGGELLGLPFEICIKILPASTYAVFHLKGAEITSDWSQLILRDWMPASGYVEAYPYTFQRYDERFKGLDQIESSVLDVYIPVKTLQ
ncbi:MAG: GyrI-like domain-containing protein [Anaerolineales bacterium]|nr:GyrI-like domain-containing protein [Anaerolineales bacterium]